MNIAAFISSKVPIKSSDSQPDSRHHTLVRDGITSALQKKRFDSRDGRAGEEGVCWTASADAMVGGSVGLRCAMSVDFYIGINN